MSWCSELCSRCALFLFNSVDLLCGLALLTYGLFLGSFPPPLRQLSLSRVHSSRCRWQCVQDFTTTRQCGSLVLAAFGV